MQKEMISPEVMRLVMQEKSQRCKIKIMLQARYTYDVIQTALKCSPQTISSVKKLIEKDELVLPLKPGPKVKINEEVKSIILNENFSNPSMNLRSLSFHLKKQNINASKTSIDSVLLSNRYWYGPMIQEPFLTEEQKQTRMNFAYSVLVDQINPEFIGFSDESTFKLDAQHPGVWHHYKKYNPLCVKQKSKYSPSLMIWGMVGKNFKSKLVFVEKTMNQKYYKDNIINTDIIPDAINSIGENFIFQQDGATSHTTPLNIASIRKISRIMLIWPANSPDFNIIEMIWAIIKRRIDQVMPKNIDELKSVILEVWENLDMETINGLIDDFPRRCLLALKNKGENIQKFISGGKLDPVTDEEIQEVINQLQADGITLKKIENIIGEKISEEEFQRIELSLKKRKTNRPIVKWTKEKDKILTLLFEMYGRDYEKIKSKFTEDVTIGALKNRIYNLFYRPKKIMK